MAKITETLKELIRELVKCGQKEHIIRSVQIGLQADEEEQSEINYKRMIKWLRAMKNPTMNDIMVKTYLIMEESEMEV